MGIAIEKEHTKDKDLAADIALQHLDEFPDYYTKLKKMESDARKEHKNFKDVKEGIRDWFGKSKSIGKKRKPGWVEVVSGEPCAREEGEEDETPKCVSSDKRASMTKSERISAQRRKSAADPNQPEKSGAAKPTYVSTDKPKKKMNEEQDIKGKGSGTKDACYTKVKSRYSVWPSAYACVPIETSKALTKEGWKYYEELNIGDQILTFNLEQNNLEFKPIQNLHFYTDTPTYVIKNGNTGWKFECTPNHKWVVQYPECKSGKDRKKYKNLINNMQLVSIEELLNESGSNRKLVISSKYNEGTPISLNKIYKYETNWIEYLLNCSKEQRESWLYSAIVYDGNQVKTERLTEKKEDQSDFEYAYDTPHNKQSFGFKQKDINHRDAFLLSAFLNKGLVTFKKNIKTDIYGCHYVSYNGTKSLEGFKLIETRKSNVWCPQTENGTWVMMQETDGNGIITITGNSGALVKCRKVGAANWGNKSESINLSSKDSISEEMGMRYCPKCEKDETRDVCKYGPKYWDMFSLPSRLSPNQMKFSIAQVHPANESKEPDHEYSMARSELSTIISAAKRLRGKLNGEGNIEAWVQSKITKAADYIDAAADYLDSREHNVQGSMDEACWKGYKKKGMKTMFGKRYPNCVKAEGFSNWRSDFGLSEDWQKVNRKDKTDGLSQAAVNAYRKENPGSKLQTAVTEKKPKGKRAKRRANFCRRMSGMKAKLTSAKTARDPDSRINKALRRWNCN